MFSPDELASDLPHRQESEPENLRQDILDELADHLACAQQRELQRMACGGQVPGNAEQEIKQRVIERFGDPVQVARRLWWDAMWEQVMNQRVQSIAMICMVLVMLGMFGLLWNQQSQSQSLAQQERESNRLFQQDMLNQLQQLRQASDQANANAPPSEWNRLTVRCVWGTEDGPPAEGVTLTVRAPAASMLPVKKFKTDSRGIVDFGRVHYGGYTLEIATPGGLHRPQTISVHPGEDRSTTIVCPPLEGRTDVQLQAAVPAVDEPPPQWHAEWPKSLGFSDLTSLKENVWTIDVYQTEFRTPGFNDPWAPIGTHQEYVLTNVAGRVVPLQSLELQPVDRSQAAGYTRIADFRVTIPELKSTDSHVGHWMPGTYYLDRQYTALTDPADPSGMSLLLITSPVELHATYSRRYQEDKDVAYDIDHRIGWVPNSVSKDVEVYRGPGSSGLWRSKLGNSAEHNPSPDLYRIRFGQPSTSVQLLENTLIPSVLEYANLAQRIPKGMSIAYLRCRVEIPPGLAPAGPAELVWKGKTVSLAGDIQEERVVLAAVEVIDVESASRSRNPESVSYVTINDDAAVPVTSAAQANMFLIRRDELPGSTVPTKVDPELLMRLNRHSPTGQLKLQNVEYGAFEIPNISNRDSVQLYEQIDVYVRRRDQPESRFQAVLRGGVIRVPLNEVAKVSYVCGPRGESPALQRMDSLRDSIREHLEVKIVPSSLESLEHPVSDEEVNRILDELLPANAETPEVSQGN